MDILYSLFNKLAKISEKRVDEFGARYIAFGIFSSVNYLIPMYMWSIHSNLASVYTVRIVSIILCFMLVVSDSWYDNYKKYRPLFWHFSIMFCLPFFVTFMICLDGVNLFWIININIAISLGIILLDFRSFAVIYPIGIVLGAIVSIILGHRIHINLSDQLIYPAFYMTIFLSVILIVFSRDLNRKYDLQMKAMRTLAAYIAHEMRTPLSTISLIIKGLNVSGLSQNELKRFERKKEAMLDEVNYMLNIIDVTLYKLAFNTNRSVSMEELSAGDFVKNAIDQYPFFERDQELVHVNVNKDFKFRVNKNLLTHVLFNLIQNALYQIKAEKKGEVFVTVNQAKKWNFISVKDTASGIKSSEISNIFQPFATSKDQGMGVGLHFCKTALYSMDATIHCESIYGKYAEFIIKF